MEVQYYTKNVYGNVLIYLVDSEAARAMLSLIGQRTISEHQMELFKRLGHIFTRTFEPGNK